VAEDVAKEHSSRLHPRRNFLQQLLHTKNMRIMFIRVVQMDQSRRHTDRRPISMCVDVRYNIDQPRQATLAAKSDISIDNPSHQERPEAVSLQSTHSSDKSPPLVSANHPRGREKFLSNTSAQ
jgi:hypothetical protein